MFMNRVVAILAFGVVPSSVAFAPIGSLHFTTSRATVVLGMANVLSLTLEKPLGIVLEEIEEGASGGVKVEEIVETGSAYKSDYRDKLVGLKVAQVMGEDVTAVNFDQVMQMIVDAPSPLTIDFELPGEIVDPKYEVGTTVTISVIQEGKPALAIEAKVGDNLRKVLLDNDVELYRGLKKKMGNCGGGGQCTFCAVDFRESDGWEVRSDYEESKIGKFPTARLACMNNIQGPATIRIQ